MLETAIATLKLKSVLQKLIFSIPIIGSVILDARKKEAGIRSAEVYVPTKRNESLITLHSLRKVLEEGASEALTSRLRNAWHNDKED